jgi:hypothetical protein
MKAKYALVLYLVTSNVIGFNNYSTVAYGQSRGGGGAATGAQSGGQIGTTTGSPGTGVLSDTPDSQQQNELAECESTESSNALWSGILGIWAGALTGLISFGALAGAAGGAASWATSSLLPSCDSGLLQLQFLLAKMNRRINEVFREVKYLRDFALGHFSDDFNISTRQAANLGLNLTLDSTPAGRIKSITDLPTPLYALKTYLANCSERGVVDPAHAIDISYIQGCLNLVPIAVATLEDMVRGAVEADKLVLTAAEDKRALGSFRAEVIGYFNALDTLAGKLDQEIRESVVAQQDAIKKAWGTVQGETYDVFVDFGEALPPMELDRRASGSSNDPAFGDKYDRQSFYTYTSVFPYYGFEFNPNGLPLFVPKNSPLLDYKLKILNRTVGKGTIDLSSTALRVLSLPTPKVAYWDDLNASLYFRTELVKKLLLINGLGTTTANDNEIGPASELLFKAEIDRVTDMRKGILESAAKLPDIRARMSRMCNLPEAKLRVASPADPAKPLITATCPVPPPPP